MNATRLDDLERSISGVSRKVLHACPVAEAWTPRDIHTEILRQGHSSIDRRTLDGCLNALRDSGLVREPEHGCFIRVTAKARVVDLPRHLVAAKPPASVKTLVPVKTDDDLLDRFATIATALRAHSNASLELAEKVEALGIEVADQIQRAEQGGAKLKQLQELLKSIGQ